MKSISVFHTFVILQCNWFIIRLLILLVKGIIDKRLQLSKPNRESGFWEISGSSSYFFFFFFPASRLTSSSSFMFLEDLP